MINRNDDIQLEDLYQFFSSLVPQFRSTETIQFDLKHHLKIELDEAKKIYNNVYRILINNIHGSQFKLVTSCDHPSYKVHKNLFDRPSVHKFLFCTEDKFFIDKWVSYYKDFIGEDLYSSLTSELQTSYCEKNNTVNDYSKRVRISNILNSIDENLISFYDYSRWYYLTGLVTSCGCTPMFYDSSSGRLYFTMTIKKNGIREQILEGIKFHTGSCKSIPLFIQTGYGTAIISKDSKDQRRTIETNLANNIPNFIELVIYNILKSGKRMSSLDNIILKSYNNLLFVEDYCKKSDDGLEMELPIKNNIWQRMEAKMLRNYSKDKANVTSLVSEYTNSLINPITQAIWS